MNIKVLQLERWMRSPKLREQCLQVGQLYKPTESIFNRPGLYLHGNECWFELADGRACTYPIDSFRRELELLNVQHLNHRQIHALEQIVENKLSTSHQRRLLQLARQNQSVRWARLAGLRARLRLLDRKKRLTL